MDKFDQMFELGVVISLDHCPHCGSKECDECDGKGKWMTLEHLLMFVVTCLTICWLLVIIVGVLTLTQL